MKILDRNSRAKIGRTSVSWRVKLFALTLKDALDRGDEELSLNLALEFFQQFRKSWKSSDARFFRDLAHCVEHKGIDLNPVQVWLRRRMFRDESDTEKQTEFLTAEQILNELAAHTPYKKLSDRRLQDHMKKIGAVVKNSKRRK